MLPNVNISILLKSSIASATCTGATEVGAVGTGIRSISPVNLWPCLPQLSLHHLQLGLLALYITQTFSPCAGGREGIYQIARGAVWEMKRVKQAGSDHITTIAALAEKAKESPWGTIL